MGNTQSKLAENLEENMTIPIPKKVKDIKDPETIEGEWNKYTMTKSYFSFGVGGINSFEVYVLVNGDDVLKLFDCI